MSRPLLPLLLPLALVVGLCSSIVALPAKEASAPVPRPRRVYETTRLSGPPPAIDGRLDDACWQSTGEWSSVFTQLTPQYGAAASQATEIKILYDDRNLYVAMRAHDEPIAARSRQQGERDGFVGDIMGVNFDSYHDQRTGFEFDLTAAGQKIDLVLANNGWDTTWNAVWEGKVAHEADCWTAEFLIPLSQLRFDPRNTVWGLHAWRWIDRFKEESDWNLLANDDSGLVKSFGELHGITGLRSARRWELLPYASMRMESAPNRDSHAVFHTGVDAKVGLSSNFTLDASVLPDFGQVESDPAVMNLTAFETYLTEKRPLFLEGKDIFAFPFGEEPLFYSRRIGAPPSFVPGHLASDMPDASTLLGALKVSGKTNGGTSVGVLAAATDRETVLVDDGAGSRTAEVAPRTGYLVARGQQDFRAGDTVVGGIVTHVQRTGLSSELAAQLPETASVVGADVTHYWQEREYFFHAVALATDVRGKPAAIARLQTNSARYYQRPIDGYERFDATLDRLSGEGLWLQGGKASKGHWRWTEDLMIKSPGLEFNDLGYLAQADQRKLKTSASYVEKDPAGWYRSYELKLEQENTWTTRGEHLGSGVDLRASTEFANKWNGNALLGATGAGRDPVALRGGPLLYAPSRWNWSGYLETDVTKRLWANVHAEGCQSAQDAFSSSAYGAKVSVRPADSLVLTVAADATTYSDRQQYTASDRARWLVSRLEGESRSLSLRAEWHLRPELSVQYFGNPFGSTVRYTDYRQVALPEAAALERRFGPVLAPSIADGNCSFDFDADGAADCIFARPDWNDASFRSNLVLRWEYRLGSTLYFAWSQQRYGGSSELREDAWSSLTSLRSQRPVNQFMVKVTYWFSS
ncbi:hypothetical protein DB347_07365 [Opitutaceae bacterium EW11]|nr:hypothetical protein DB347_07365 [Opitutaceae bacterium EW11]